MRIFLCFKVAPVLLLVAIFLFLFAVTAAQDQPDLSELLKVARAAAPLSENEKAQALRLAEGGLKAERLLPDRKTLLTSIQVYRNTEAEKKGVFERHAMLLYYRYAGDVTIRVTVNLARRRVSKIDQLAHFPSPLAPEEIKRAQELALNHSQLKREFAPFLNRLIVEAHLTTVPGPKSRLFGHRLVNLFFRVGPRYLVEQGAILVDLTTEEVLIVPNPKTNSQH
jgi:hypothetical protein